jgi:hypothetical protein
MQCIITFLWNITKCCFCKQLRKSSDIARCHTISCSYKAFVPTPSAVLLTTMCSTVALLGLSVLCGLVSGTALNRQQWGKSYLQISARCEWTLLVRNSDLWCVHFSSKSYYLSCYICSAKIFLVENVKIISFVPSIFGDFLVNGNTYSGAISLQNTKLVLLFQITWNFWKEILGWNRWIRRWCSEGQLMLNARIQRCHA